MKVTPLPRLRWFTVAVLVAAGAPAQAEPAGARARFSEAVFDFGRIMPNAVQRHDFVVTNTGDAPLVISAVEPGCGCTTAGDWDREIAPGKNGKIPIQFNPSNFSGEIAKAISVTCNDPGQPRAVLEIHANIWRPFDMEPAFVSFLPVEGEPGSETRTVRIVNRVEAPATLELAHVLNPRFRAELETVRPGHEFALRVSYDSALAAGGTSAVIALRTSNAEQPLLSLSAFAMPQPAVAVVPATVQLPAGRLDAGYSFNLVIRNNGRAPLTVRDPATNIPGTKLRLTESDPGRLFYLNLSWPEGFAPPADQAAFVEFKTSHPKFHELHVPVVQAAAATAAATPAPH